MCDVFAVHLGYNLNVEVGGNCNFSLSVCPVVEIVWVAYLDFCIAFGNMCFDSSVHSCSAVVVLLTRQGLILWPLILELIVACSLYTHSYAVCSRSMIYYNGNNVNWYCDKAVVVGYVC